MPSQPSQDADQKRLDDELAGSPIAQKVEAPQKYLQGARAIQAKAKIAKMADGRSDGKKGDRKPGRVKNPPAKSKKGLQERIFQRDAEIERMIEAKVSQALRLMH